MSNNVEHVQRFAFTAVTGGIRFFALNIQKGLKNRLAFGKLRTLDFQNWQTKLADTLNILAFILNILFPLCKIVIKISSNFKRVLGGSVH